MWVATVFLIKNPLYFLISHVPFGPGLSTTSNDYFPKANFERLGRRRKGSENFGKWFLYFGFMLIKHGTNLRKIRCIDCWKKIVKKPWLFSLLQCFAPSSPSLLVYPTSIDRHFLKSWFLLLDNFLAIYLLLFCISPERSFQPFLMPPLLYSFFLLPTSIHSLGYCLPNPCLPWYIFLLPSQSSRASPSPIVQFRT